MKRALRLLLVEDSEDDALFLLRELRRAGGHEPISERVETPEEMAAALDGASWDVVVSDYFVPDFGALEALALLKQKDLDLPFIVVSGKVGEEAAVEAMRAGAHDYVMKNNLARLGPTIERELGEAEHRREKREAEKALKGSEQRFRATFDRAPVGIAHVSADGRWLRVNERLCEMVGYAPEELLGRTIQSIAHPDDVPAELDCIRRALGGEIGTYSLEKRCVRKDYSQVWVCQNVSLIRGPSGDARYFIFVVDDVTERKRAELLLRSMTPREVEVLRLVARGRTNREIAREMSFSVGTAKLHVQHIIAKMGVSDRTQAAVRATELGLLPE